VTGVVLQPCAGLPFGVLIAPGVTAAADGLPGRPSPCALKGSGPQAGPEAPQ